MDIGPDIAKAKQDWRDRGDAAQHFGSVRDLMLTEIEAIRSDEAAGRPVIPELTFADIVGDAVDAATIAAIRRRGCVVVRGVIPTAQAIEWNDEVAAYVERNDYLGKAAAKAGMDSYFSKLQADVPQIYGIYWSRPQIMARQAESMAVTKRFLNSLYDASAPGGAEFDPSDDFSYADRVRRRTPGDATFGLRPHVDAGSFERWLDPAYQRIYADVFRGRFDDFDPWQGAYRTKTREFQSPAVCSMYRTFQGWTALTPQGPEDGTLRLIPIAKSIAYLLLRALQPDVADDDLCGATPGRSLGVLPEWHAELLDGLVSIPLLQPGDTIWWQPDVVHSVAETHAGVNDANVIYVGASPRCEKNEIYARRQAQHFIDGRSAPDFAAQDYEVDFVGRATIDDLTELGRRQMAL